MGAILTLNQPATDTSLPILRAAPILSSGSLALFNGYYGSLGSSFPSGAVTNSTYNVAHEEAKAVIGSGDSTTLSFNSSNSLASPNGIVEITPKKGLHTIISQVSHSGQFCRMSLPTLIKDYVAANLNHVYYVSQWHKKTRAYVAGLDYSEMTLYFQTTAQYLMTAPVANVAVSGVTTTFSRSSTAVNDLNPQHKSRALPGGTIGTISSVSTAKNDAANAIFAGGGGIHAYATTSNYNKFPSVILYQYYLEDLTVSGRTFAEVDALDHQLFTTAFASGGIFYGDTFTNPTTLP